MWDERAVPRMPGPQLDTWELREVTDGTSLNLEEIQSSCWLEMDITGGGRGGRGASGDAAKVAGGSSLLVHNVSPFQVSSLENYLLLCSPET